ncbi:MAG: response regulator transcription factor [Planctomycetales bacterium]|nr:response regulator transcription factor [Planctomycetales bacterium]
MPKIRVLLADDHAVLRAGLKMLVNHQQDMEVVAEAGTFAETARTVKLAKPDIIVLDLTMPDGSGIDKMEMILRECPAARILVLTMHDDPAYLRAALNAGASGYVVKKVADTELLNAIRAVHAGRAFIDLDLQGARSPGAIVASPGETAAGPPGDNLSLRERTVLQRLAQGHTNQSIAEQLDLSVKTIESYRARLLKKLGLKSRADLVRYAVLTGLLKGNGESLTP